MFNTIITLLEIGFWGATIFIFIAGLIFLVEGLKSEDGTKKTIAVFSLILSVVAFILAYKWVESIGFSIFASGCVLCLIKAEDCDVQSTSTQSSNDGESYIGEIVNQIVQDIHDEEVIANGVEKGIRRSKE